MVGTQDYDFGDAVVEGRNESICERLFRMWDVEGTQRWIDWLRIGDGGLHQTSQVTFDRRRERERERPHIGTLLTAINSQIVTHKIDVDKRQK